MSKEAKVFGAILLVALLSITWWGSRTEPSSTGERAATSVQSARRPAPPEKGGTRSPARALVATESSGPPDAEAIWVAPEGHDEPALEARMGRKFKHVRAIRVDAAGLRAAHADRSEVAIALPGGDVTVAVTKAVSAPGDVLLVVGDLKRVGAAFDEDDEAELPEGPHGPAGALDLAIAGRTLSGDLWVGTRHYSFFSGADGDYVAELDPNSPPLFKD